MEYDGLLFDLDGTLWDATENIRISWNIALQEFEDLKDRNITKEELQSVMGLPMDEIVARLFPDLPKEMQIQVLNRCCEFENKYLSEHGGVLYPMLRVTLDLLYKKYKLFIVSNGQSGYIQSFLTAHKLTKYFTDFQNWGDNKVSKGENIKLVMERNNIKKAAYIGDTSGDADAASSAGIDFIYARYGFGEVKEYVYAIDDFMDLAEIRVNNL
jgi:phosphoglycolate phosphatase